jgi:hypothetical protein
MDAPGAVLPAAAGSKLARPALVSGRF